MNLDRATAVVRELGIENAVDEKIDLLYNRLIDEESDAVRRADGRKVSILASLLTTVNVFINYASTRRRLDTALDWLRHDWGAESQQEAVSLLGTMTLLYIVDAGMRLHASDPDKLKTWSRLRQYVGDVEAEVMTSLV
jgi:hypothetical protein